MLTQKLTSRSFGLALPALISETRDFRKDRVDEVLVRLALGEVCEKASTKVQILTQTLQKYKY
jgi:hypothetical protein